MESNKFKDRLQTLWLITFDADFGTFLEFF